MMVDFPSHQFTANVADLGRTVVVRELTIGYIKQSQNDPDYDTPERAILDATDISDDEFLMLGRRTVSELYQKIIELTYPNLEELLQQDIDPNEVKKN